MLAATAGFSPFNFPKARVFLGDVGSHALGYCLSLLLGRALLDGGISTSLAFMLLSALLIDTGLTLSLRIVRAEHFWRAHCDHLYQWALRVGSTHARVCVCYASWTIVMLLLALRLQSTGPTSQATVAWLVALTAATIYFLLKRRWLNRIGLEPML